jgi:type II secretory pathway pseudopilin PulG
LIELMVVIGIIVLAAGLMTPTIADFFKNRQLETIRGHIGAAFNKARLSAVTRGIRASLVFFREGARVYLEKERRFDEDDLFSPETSPLADDSVWYVLGFLDKKPSLDLEGYRSWEKTQKLLLAEAEDRGGKRGGVALKDQVDVSGLPRITFERDGSLTFATGSDVATSEFKKEIPETADIAIFSSLSNTGCFIDLRLPGQIRSRMVPLKEPPARPQARNETAIAAQFTLEADGSENRGKSAAAGPAAEDRDGAAAGSGGDEASSKGDTEGNDTGSAEK